MASAIRKIKDSSSTLRFLLTVLLVNMVSSDERYEFPQNCLHEPDKHAV